MVAAIALFGAFLAVLVGLATFLVARLELNLHQALLYAPLKLLFRINDGATRTARNTDPPVIYAIWHQSHLEPALMLSLLPDDTLHILDEASSQSIWLDPWRALARCIAFRAHHVFVSRRLVRRLKGNGRLAVYLPDEESPEAKSFRLFRAISRIAARADARVVPVYVDGARETLFSLAPGARRRLAPKLRLIALPPLTIAEMIALAGDEKPLAAQAFFQRMIAVRNPPPEPDEDGGKQAA